MSKIIKAVSGKAFHLPGKDLDTDRIMPARFLKQVTFDGLGKHVFEDDREQLEGRHPFDLPDNQGASILVVDQNFGSGSSREHVVPGLTQWGIKAIIGLSFAEIFRGNAISYGLVCVEVNDDGHRQIIEALKHERVFGVDLTSMLIDVVYEDGVHTPHVPCIMPKAHRDMLTMGCWDMLATALEAGEEIEKTAASLPYMVAQP